MMIDATRDLRGIAAALGRSEFEIAKIAYGLVSTGVVELAKEQSARPSAEAALGAEPALERARSALAGRRPEEALSNARAALAVDPASTEARLLAARALNRLARYGDAVDELRRAVQGDPLTPAVHLDLGFAAVRVADFASAHASWEHYLRLAPTASDAGRARAALETLTRLMHLVEAHADG
jgi:tetratricopeptide (TPR) repeat protein